MTGAELDWFRANGVAFDILGANYYPWSYGELKKWPDGKFGTIVRRARGHKIALILGDAWQRYRMPLMITETSSNGDTKVREKWMDETLETVRPPARQWHSGHRLHLVPPLHHGGLEVSQRQAKGR